MKILFREMKFLDINQVKKLNEDNLPENYDKEFWIDTFHNQAKHHSFVAVTSCDIIGYIFADEQGIISLAVANEFRCKGIAKELMKWSLNTYNSIINLNVRKSNLPAINLYNQLGFREKCTIEKYYDNPTEDSLLLECDRTNKTKYKTNKKKQIN